MKTMKTQTKKKNTDETFPVVTLLQRPGEALDPSWRLHLLQELVHIIEVLVQGPGKRGVLLVKPECCQLLRYPKTNTVHIVHRYAPDHVKLRKEQHDRRKANTTDLE